MREIVLDTETTGLDPYQGHRLVEIGCIELVNRIPERTELSQLPQSRARHAGGGLRRPWPFGRVPQGQAARLPRSPRICWHSSAMRRWSPTTPRSISASSTPSSNARARCWSPRERLVDTLLLARRKHPGGPNRLDDLCARYGIDNSRRTKHGALLDAEILAEVYLELIGARQAQLILVEHRPWRRRRVTAASPSSACGRSRSRPGSPRTSAKRMSRSWRRSGEDAIWRRISARSAPLRPDAAPSAPERLASISRRRAGCGACICAARCW